MSNASTKTPPLPDCVSQPVLHYRRGARAYGAAPGALQVTLFFTAICFHETCWKDPIFEPGSCPSDLAEVSWHDICLPTNVQEVGLRLFGLKRYLFTIKPQYSWVACGFQRGFLKLQDGYLQAEKNCLYVFLCTISVSRETEA